MLKRLESLEVSFLKYGVAALLIVIPLYPKFPLFQIPGSWVAIRAEDFLIAFVFLFWLFYQAQHKFEFLKDDLNKTIITYLIIGFLSFASAILITHSIVPYIGFLHTLRRVEYLVALFIMVTSIKKEEDVIFYAEVICLTSFLIFLYGIGQRFFLFPVISTMNVEFAKGIALRLQSGARVSSTFAGHYDLAAYLVLLLPFTAAVLVGAKNKIQKVVLGVMFIASFWLLLVSASRISFFAYLIGIAFTLWFLKKKLWIIPVLTLSVVASLFTPQLTERYSRTFQVALIGIKQIKFTLPWEKQPTIISFVPEITPTPIAGPPVVKKIREIPTPTPSEKTYYFYGAGEEIPQTEDRSIAIRLKVEWPRALRALAKNPLLGTGYSSITLATDNDYLRTLGEVGILGFLAFGLILFKIADRARRFLFLKETLTFEETLIIGISGAFLGFLANAFFIDVFEASKVAITFWLLVGLLIGIIKLKYKEAK
ncbi:hypothetical protein COU95_02650 [Candidatus Shapirobacteria bacterium CG10_big_fil_rev_8_21_14_0_10_40_9]|uniref:O-antigen ligase-related domain-containing protein n=1 Tax=Candidatus Shapirobacteria bacterium CG10_big_fil_rev_8_21_14_0_10_40_9 TaxID=1974888 RepID=A0A2M8L395_9BACT|nr:MAG: hypothetical protein COU95_02650 [Candidatus Shapirobacteria bacterium CG10_big_fil_rev_8_21_14_0_10_40_9]